MTPKPSKEFLKHQIRCKDGELGKIIDFYFDDNTWHIRYVVIDTTKWFMGGTVLLMPYVFVGSEPTSDGMWQVNLTKEQVEQSPKPHEHAPVNRRLERELHEHYDLKPYWVFDAFAMPQSVSAIPLHPTGDIDRHSHITDEDIANYESQHLRSCDEVIGYRVDTQDGRFGRVNDVLIDTSSWQVSHFVVHTRRWLPGGPELCVPKMIVEDLDFPRRSLRVNVTEETLRGAPPYDEEIMDRLYEDELTRYFLNAQHMEQRYVDRHMSG